MDLVMVETHSVVVVVTVEPSGQTSTTSTTWIISMPIQLSHWLVDGSIAVAVAALEVTLEVVFAAQGLPVAVSWTEELPGPLVGRGGP
jgi:hypothetical protein